MDHPRAARQDAGKRADTHSGGTRLRPAGHLSGKPAARRVCRSASSPRAGQCNADHKIRCPAPRPPLAVHVRLCDMGGSKHVIRSLDGSTWPASRRLWSTTMGSSTVAGAPRSTRRESTGRQRQRSTATASCVASGHERLTLCSSLRKTNASASTAGLSPGRWTQSHRTTQALRRPADESPRPIRRSASSVAAGSGRQLGWPGAQNVWSARCSGDVGRDDVGGVTVQGDSGPVVAHGGARIRVGRRLLHVTQRDAGVEGGDEGVAQSVRAIGLAIPARRATRRTIRAAP